MSEFMTGTFVAYKARTKIHLGKVQKDLNQNEVVQFDGVTLKFQGQEIAYPEFNAALKAGWFIPVGEEMTELLPVAAGVKVRPAQGQDPAKKPNSMSVDTVTDDERVVGSVKKEAPPVSPSKVIVEEDRYVGFATKAAREKAEGAQFEAQAQVNVTPPPVSVKPVTPAQAYREKVASVPKADEVKVSATPQFHEPTVTVSMSEPLPVELPDSVGRTVGKIRTPAKQATVVSDSSSAMRETSRLDNSPPPKAIGLEAKPKPPVTTRADLSYESATGDVVSPRASDTLEGLLPNAARPPEVTRVIVASSGDNPPVVQEESDFIWEMKVRHWKTRVKEAIDMYSDNPGILARIKAVEPLMVWKNIEMGVAKKQGRLISSE